MAMAPNRQVRVLIVDPYTETLSRLEELFTSYFPQSSVATTSTTTALAYELLQRSQFDFILVSSTVKDTSTMAFCAEVRQLPGYAKTPLMMLSAHAETAKKLSGFASGIDDYVTSPVDDRLLASRIRLLCRMHGTNI